jgi:hypothetical protein
MEGRLKQRAMTVEHSEPQAHTLQVRCMQLLSVVVFPPASSRCPSFLLHLSMQPSARAAGLCYSMRLTVLTVGSVQPTANGLRGTFVHPSLSFPLCLLRRRAVPRRRRSGRFALSFGHLAPKELRATGSACASGRRRRRSVRTLGTSPRHPFVRHAVCTGLPLAWLAGRIRIGTVAVRWLAELAAIPTRPRWG